jgi:hypothetical protein
VSIHVTLSHPRAERSVVLQKILSSTKYVIELRYKWFLAKKTRGSGSFEKDSPLEIVAREKEQKTRHVASPRTWKTTMSSAQNGRGVWITLLMTG